MFFKYVGEVGRLAQKGQCHPALSTTNSQALELSTFPQQWREAAGLASGPHSCLPPPA